MSELKIKPCPSGRNLNDVEDEWNKRSDNDKL